MTHVDKKKEFFWCVIMKYKDYFAELNVGLRLICFGIDKIYYITVESYRQHH